MNQNKNKPSGNGGEFPDIGKIQYGLPGVTGAGGAKKTAASRTSQSLGTARGNNGASGEKAARADGSGAVKAKKTGTRVGGTAKTGTSANADKVKGTRTAPAVKTPEQLAEEKRIRLQNERKKELMRKRLAEQQRIAREERAKKRAAFFKKARAFGINAFAGLLAAVAILLIVSVVYSRIVTTYNTEVASTGYAFYSYIDPEDETKAAEQRRAARENGKESAKVTFKKKHKVIDSVAYLPILPLTDFFNLSVSGDGNVRTVTVLGEGAENSVVFTSGTRDITVNGSLHSLDNAPIFEGGDVYVPFEFFTEFIEGIEFGEQEKWGVKTLKVYLMQPRISFKGAPDIALEVPNIQDYFTSAESEYKYSFDLTPYEQYINPTDPDKYLILINPDNRLAADYEPEDLIDIIYTRNDRQKQKMRRDAAKSLEAFLSAAAAEGINDVTVTSGYRTYAYQNQLFTGRVNQKMATGAFATRAAAEAEAAKFTMYPGASEHQSGLCIDMHNLSSAMQVFAETTAYSWLYKHCADFGFILRYPRNKEDVTGISFEPWHYRFVGRYHAQRIMESGMCLEEYIATLNLDDGR